MLRKLTSQRHPHVLRGWVYSSWWQILLWYHPEVEVFFTYLYAYAYARIRY